MLLNQNLNQNRILASLSPENFNRIINSLELVSLPFGKMLNQPGGAVKEAYFPTTAILSLHQVMECGASVESAGVGNEGVLGISLLMGEDITPTSAMVQTAGNAYRMPCKVLKEEFSRGGEFQQLILRYIQMLISEISQSVACKRHHSVEQQLCRCLLTTLDRLESNELILTQELAATMLGVRREGVTAVACKLQEAGVIKYRRGHITVVDRLQLETSACECYAAIKKQRTRIFAEERVH